jgi:hypothetical protein
VSGPGSTPEGSTTKPTKPYTAVTYDMLVKDPKFYQKPLVKKIGGLAIVGLAAGYVIYSALNNNHKKDD